MSSAPSRKEFRDRLLRSRGDRPGISEDDPDVAVPGSGAAVGDEDLRVETPSRRDEGPAAPGVATREPAVATLASVTGGTTARSHSGTATDEVESIPVLPPPPPHGVDDVLVVPDSGAFADEALARPGDDARTLAYPSDFARVPVDPVPPQEVLAGGSSADAEPAPQTPAPTDQEGGTWASEPEPRSHLPAEVMARLSRHETGLTLTPERALDLVKDAAWVAQDARERAARAEGEAATLRYELERLREERADLMAILASNARRSRVIRRR
jgi:hypothetical protein